jgi:hypothetical protein
VSFRDVAAEAGLAWVHPGPAAGPLPAPVRRAEAKPAEEPGLDARALGSGAAWGDLDADGDLDLLVAGGGPDSPAAHWFENLGEKGFGPPRSLGAGAGGAGLGVFVGDIENDGDLDLYVTRDGPNLMLRNDGEGIFTDVSDSSRTAGAGELSLGASFGDMDHDGDLDLVVANFRPASPAAGDSPGAPDAVYRNNGDGTFEDLSSSIGLGPAARSTGVLFLDFDNDRDVDFLVTAFDASPRLYSNERVGSFRDVAGRVGLAEIGGAWCAVAADFNRDTDMDLFFATGRRGESRLHVNRDHESFPPERDPNVPIRRNGPDDALSALVLDYDNDGRPDLLLGSGGGDGDDEQESPLRLYRNLDGKSFEDVTRETGLGIIDPAPVRGMAAGDRDGDGDLDVAVILGGRPLLLLENVGGSSNQWIRVHPRGTRSNRTGLGLKAEIKAGGMWQKVELRGSSGFLSQSAPEVHFGLGDRAKAEGISLLWPSGNLQTHMEVSARSEVEMEEPSSKGSSCPHLFAWDGRRFRFVNDFIGTGGLGFRVGEDAFGTPDPDEYVRIGKIPPREGRIELRVVNQLEEISYFDQLDLLAIDHPAGVEVHPYERFAVEPPFPVFRLLAVEEKAYPAAAWDDRGRDVLDRLQRADRETVDDFGILRLPGYAERHALTLDFRGTDPGSAPVLFLHGWVDYETSSSNRAADQQGLSLVPPRLEASSDGETWRTVARVMGFPAGLSRTMAYDLADRLAPDERLLRIETNMRVYWDEAYLATPVVTPSPRLHRMRLDRAQLRFLGFPRAFSPDGRRPLLYDYDLVDRTAPWKIPTGHFTRYGPVDDLLASIDDRFAILAPGDEIALSFASRDLPALPEGWSRTYVLHADGFGKDLDPNTAYAGTVGPLPFHAMSGYPYGPEETYPQTEAHRRYLSEWNVRERGVR